MNKFNMFNRFAIFIVYFWFGALKLLGDSSANPLVDELLRKTLPFMTFDTFIVLLGIGEIIIALLFLFPRYKKITLTLFGLHMFTTLMPLILLPTIAWVGPFNPTLEGQYIIKNILLVAVALNIFARQR